MSLTVSATGGVTDDEGDQLFQAGIDLAVVKDVSSECAKGL